MAFVLAALFVWPAGPLPGSLHTGPSVTARAIRAGDLLHLTRAASPQFVRPIVVQAIRELTDRHTYHGWTWIEAYELDARGEAVAKRELFVRRDGLRWLTPGQAVTTATRRPGRAARSVRVPA